MIGFYRQKEYLVSEKEKEFLASQIERESKKRVWEREGGIEGKIEKSRVVGTSLAVQWLRLCISNARGVGSILDQEIKIPYVT